MENDPTILCLLASVISGETPPADIAEQDWPRVTEMAHRHGLEPMLWWTLRQTGQEAPSRVWGSLERRALASTLGYAIQAHSQQEINAALTKAGIPALWLKGAALALTIYPDPALRPMIDLDVLVPVDQCAEALRLLQGLGYTRDDVRDGLFGHRSPDQPGEALPKKQHYYLRGGSNRRVVVELHFRLMGENDQLLPPERLAWFWTQTQRLTLADGSSGLGLSPEADLLYLSAHAVLQHSETDILLMRNLDLHLLVKKQPLNWNVILDQAVELGWTAAVERALDQTQKYFNTPIPDTVLTALRSRRSDSDSALLEWRKNIAGLQHLAWIQRQLKGLAPLGRVRCLYRSIFPTPAYMRQLYGLQPDQAIWSYYFRRWYKQGSYFGRMLWNPRQRRP